MTPSVAIFPLALVLTWTALSRREDQRRREAAQEGVDRVQLAVDVGTWCFRDPPRDCPMVDDLVSSRRLLAPHAIDPWGHPYGFFCDEKDRIAYSWGPDGIPRTGDDIWPTDPR